jgi:hypothetical protein
MIATGGVLTALAHQDRAKVTDAGKFSDGTLKIARSEALSLQSSADRKAWASVAMYGVGGAAVVTGVVLWLTSGRGQAATPGTVLSATPAPGGVVVGATGRF